MITPPSERDFRIDPAAPLAPTQQPQANTTVAAALITGAKVLSRRVMGNADEARALSDQLTRKTRKQNSSTRPHSDFAEQRDSHNCSPLTPLM